MCPRYVPALCAWHLSRGTSLGAPLSGSTSLGHDPPRSTLTVHHDAHDPRPTNARHAHVRFVESRGECREVAAAADLVVVLELGPQPDAEDLKHLAGRVAAMLTGLIGRLS